MEHSKKILSILEAGRREVDRLDDGITEKLNAGGIDQASIDFWRGYSACASHVLKLQDKELAQIREMIYE